MPGPKKYREDVKALRKHAKKFEFWNKRGKGSHRIIYHPDINGRPQSFPLVCLGEGTEIRQEYLAGIISRFGLRNDFFEAKPPTGKTGRSRKREES